MRWPRPRTRDGEPTDPVPFLVVALTGFLVTYAWGPLYFAALGFTLLEALVVVTVLFLAITAGAYHRLVWHAGATNSREITVEGRLSWLLYAVAIGVALVVLLALPFLR